MHQSRGVAEASVVEVLMSNYCAASVTYIIAFEVSSVSVAPRNIGKYATEFSPTADLGPKYPGRKREGRGKPLASLA